jgi:DNA-binding beta-propeller fold protein YncE
MTTVILSIALTSVFALDFENNDFSTTNSEIPFAVEAESHDIHNITMEAVAMPDGLYAYRMVSYTIGEGGGQLVGTQYSGKPSIPGPTIIMNEGDEAIVTLINSACENNFVDGPGHPLTTLPTYSENSMLGIHVHGVHYDISDDASYNRMNMNGDSGALCGDNIEYRWVAAPGTAGAWPYHDHTFAINEIGAEELGLFGTVIINPANGQVNGLVDDNTGNISTVGVDEIDKDFVLWMVSSDALGRSIFYGNEIDYDTSTDYSKNSGVRETALWTNPNLITTHDGIYRFHVLGLGEETHAFHMHGHRWTEEIHQNDAEQAIIDVKEITPLQRHTFIIKASDNDAAALDKDPETEGSQNGTEMWMYHCHFVDHMKQGMSGMMSVLPGSDDLPIIGATFTLSDEPGNWMKTLDAGNLEIYDNLINGILSNAYDQETADTLVPATNGTGFAPKYLGVLEPGYYDTESRSIAVINPHETVLFGMKDSQTKHTITTLIYPESADRIGGNGILRAAGIGHYDQQMGIRGSAMLTDSMGTPVGLETPGLYVFVCKIHPYMFSAVVVDSPDTYVKANALGIDEFPLLDLSPKLEILTRHYNDTNGNGLFDDLAETDKKFPIQVSPATPVPLALLKTFSVITDPSNWKDYTQETWDVSLIPGLFTTNSKDVVVTLLNDDQTQVAAETIGLAHGDDGSFAAVINASLTHSIDDIPSQLDDKLQKGVGEVWINTQFERTVNKNFDGTPFDKPGTISVVDTKSWDVERKIALPEINMNHPHNMWTDEKNELIYQTQWFGTDMAIIDRESGELVKEVFAGQSPSHVMTSPADGKIYVAMNGEDTVNEFDPETFEMTRQISTGFRSHPHGHWVSTSGQYVVTPDFLGLKASIIDLDNNSVTNSTLLLGPIATGMKADESEFFTADFLGNSNTQVELDGTSDTGRFIDWIDYGVGLPIQTPISPDDKWMVTALTLGGKVAVVDVSQDPPVVQEPLLDCDPGCHGVQWGAKKDGGYYAYVTSKFSNALLVVDPEINEVVGRILLADRNADTDDRIIGYDGMGGQGVLAIPNVYDGWIQQTADACSDSKGKFKKSGTCGEELTGFLKDLKKNQLNPQDYKYTEEPEDD